MKRQTYTEMIDQLQLLKNELASARDAMEIDVDVAMAYLETMKGRIDNILRGR